MTLTHSHTARVYTRHLPTSTIIPSRHSVQATIVMAAAGVHQHSNQDRYDTSHDIILVGDSSCSETQQRRATSAYAAGLAIPAMVRAVTLALPCLPKVFAATSTVKKAGRGKRSVDELKQPAQIKDRLLNDAERY